MPPAATARPARASSSGHPPGATARRLSKVWAIGLATFPVSQVVHIPLNALLGIGGPRGAGLLEGVPLPVYGLIAGLSAGLCEELARWAAMRWLLRKDRERGWAPGVLFGAGHGGIEAIIFGALAGLELLQLLVIQIGAVPLDPAAREVVRVALEGRQEASWWVAAYAGLERVGAISCHVFMSVLVMRAVVRKNLLWLGAAILFHTALDAPLVYSDVLTEHGTLALVLAAGLFSLAATLKLREKASAGI
ncbi:MAG: YhfC family intramembrane metalloprotease [Deltaproteobacteria bacterium]|nr:YhfC family intramembrane metalloprotease [Deltaproteobacteria bacterium]